MTQITKTEKNRILPVGFYIPGRLLEMFKSLGQRIILTLLKDASCLSLLDELQFKNVMDITSPTHGGWPG